MFKKLFIPGPTHVRDEILQAQTAPMLGHRDKLYSDLQGAVTPKLQQLLYTTQTVFIFTSSGTGAMEAAIRNCVSKKCLNTVCGAFSKRMREITQANGKENGVIEVPMGQAITAEMVDKELATGQYDAVTFVHNETSTGIMHPLEEYAEVMKKYPDVISIVDAVSSMAGAKIEFDKLGLDIILAGTQKCFALPPGLAVCAVSDRALEKAKTVPNRGIYFDFIDMYSKYEQNQTPSTPGISLIQALNKQMDDILAEGLENRWARHKAMAAHIQDWARAKWELYGDENYLSVTVSNITNTRNTSIKELNAELAKRGAMISNGYGGLKDKCFRIGHMGDHTVEDMRWLTAQIDDILGL
jgi:aspartate aminotransferase-like enzyme